MVRSETGLHRMTKRESQMSSPERPGPLPNNLRMSQLTPQDNKKHKGRGRINQHRQRQKRDAEESHKKRGSLLLTPELNKTGVLKLDTPSKLAMRDEIRSLLDDNNDPLRPSKVAYDGMTPGDGGNYDADELNNVLTELRRENGRRQPHPDSSARVHVFHPRPSSNEQQDVTLASDINDNKEQTAKPSFLSSFSNATSPHKPTISRNTRKSPLTAYYPRLLWAGKKRVQHKLNRTLPSPVSPAESFGGSPVDIHNETVMLPNNGNFSSDLLIPPSPMINDGYNQKEDLPQTPATANSVQGQKYDPYPQSFSLNKYSPWGNRVKNKYKANSPPNGPMQPMICKQGSEPTEKKKLNPRRYRVRSISDSSISPSIPGNNAGTHQQKQLQQSDQEAAATTSRPLRMLKWLFPAVLVATMAWIFVEIDGMKKITKWMWSNVPFIVATLCLAVFSSVMHCNCEKDSRITKSVRMIDEMQRNCWKLTSIAVMNSRSDSNRNRNQKKQTQVNAHHDTDQQHHAPGFTFAKEQRFPVYSKHSMW